MQVEQGYLDFIPAPEDSRALISRAYSTSETLLLKFSDDGIDETDRISPALLRTNRNGTDFEVFDSH